MISVTELALGFGERTLFKDVSLKFTAGNCYGVIGANGAGKTTFLRILSGEIQQDRGEISVSAGSRLATLRQDHFAFEEFRVLETVVMGYEKLHSISSERDAIYAIGRLFGSRRHTRERAGSGIRRNGRLGGGSPSGHASLRPGCR